MSKNKSKSSMLLPWTNELEEKFINYIMRDGKKSVAKKIFLNVIKEIRASWHMNPSIVLKAAIENASPVIMVKSARVWWSVYQVPIEVKAKKKLFFACKWLLNAARSKKWKPMYKKLAEEILAAYSWQWYAVKKREEAQKMAEANKAFAYMSRYVR